MDTSGDSRNIASKHTTKPNKSVEQRKANIQGSCSETSNTGQKRSVSNIGARSNHAGSQGRSSNHHQDAKQGQEKSAKRLRKEALEEKRAWKEAQDTAAHACLMDKLSGCESVQEQMMRLMVEQEHTAEEEHIRGHIQQWLQKVLGQYIPGCEVMQFGSSVSGIGVRNCDLDLFLRLDPDKVTLREAGKDQQTGIKHRILQCASLICGGSENQEDLGNMVKLIRKILEKHGRGFIHEIFAIPAARCPIVKFVHTASGIHCDLSINNILALENTRLLQWYFSLDSSLRALVYTVRHWARRRGLTHSEELSRPGLSSYALTLLVVQYLGARQRLPSVDTLAQAQDDKMSHQGWDCSMRLDPALVPEHQDSDCNFQQLLGGFYQYLCDADLVNSVVMTRVCQTVTKEAFQEMGDEKNRCKVSALCVQDPFVLDFNTTKNVPEQTAALFVHELQQAATKCSSARMSCATTPGQAWGLKYLFSGEDVTEMPSETLQKVNSQFTLPIERDQLVRLAKLTGVIKHPDLVAAWYSKAKDLLLWILCEVFHFGVQVESEVSSATKDAVGDKVEACMVSSSSSSGEVSGEGAVGTYPPLFSVTLRCSTSHILWDSRRSAKVTSQIPDTYDPFENEIGISEVLMEQRKGMECKRTFNYNVKLLLDEVTSENMKVMLSLILDSAPVKKDHSHFNMFCKEFARVSQTLIKHIIQENQVT